MTCASPYPRVAAEMLACGVRWGWQCWERAGCAPAAGRASWPICLQALATAPEQFSYLEAHFYNSTAPGFFFFKYRESVCCRTHGSFLLRVVLCRGKICRAGPLSFSSSSSTPALSLPALGSAICAAGKEPQTLGFLVASHLHHNLLQTVSSWPSIATCMQQALKPLPFFSCLEAVSGTVSTFPTYIYPQITSGCSGANYPLHGTASTTSGNRGSPAVPFLFAGAVWGENRAGPQPTGIDPFSRLSFPFLANEGVSPPSSAGQFPSDVLLRCLTKYY